MIKIEATAPENLEVEIFKEELFDDLTILIIKAIGLYRYGSQGSDEANYIQNRTAQGIILTDPDAVVFDYSELEYEWGNGLDYSIRVARRITEDNDGSLPIIFVTGEKSDKGIISYYQDRYNICKTPKEGLEMASKMAKDWLNELLRT